MRRSGGPEARRAEPAPILEDPELVFRPDVQSRSVPMHRGGLPTFGHTPSQWSICRKASSVGTAQCDIVVKWLTDEVVDHEVLCAAERLDERVGVASLVNPAAAEEVSARELQDPALEGRGVIELDAEETDRHSSGDSPIDAVGVGERRPTESK